MDHDDHDDAYLVMACEADKAVAAVVRGGRPRHQLRRGVLGHVQHSGLRTWRAVSPVSSDQTQAEPHWHVGGLSHGGNTYLDNVLAPAVVAGRVALGVRLLREADVQPAPGLPHAKKPERVRHIHLRVLAVGALA